MTWQLMTSDPCPVCRGEGETYHRYNGFAHCHECGGAGHTRREMTADEAIEHLLSRIEALEARNDA